MQKRKWRPAFVIGVPVGFVNVEAAKELILSTDVPHIVNRGRKGGSNVAAAIASDLAVFAFFCASAAAALIASDLAVAMSLVTPV